MVKYLIFIILHLLGDFYLQTTKVAQCKNARKGPVCGGCKKCKDDSWINWKFLLVHSLLYIVPFLTLYFVMEGTCLTVAIGVLWVTHVLVDMVSCYFNRKKKLTFVFIIDQALHLGVICLIQKFLVYSPNIGGDYYVALKTAFVGLVLIRPCSIMINKLFCDVYTQTDEGRLLDIGSIIGVMERLMTFIFACFDSFSAIAIIITVKTWARTNDLKEPEFRNKYLLGTLTSLVLSLIVFIIYKAI